MTTFQYEVSPATLSRTGELELVFPWHVLVKYHTIKISQKKA